MHRMPVNRRHVALALACWPATRLPAQPEEPRPRYKVSAAQLHEALAARFPQRFGLAGLLELKVSAPQLLLLPARNKLGVSLLAEASGPVVRTPPQGGELDLAFGLRYEGADQTLRAQQPEILDIRLPGLSAESARDLRGLLPALSRQLASDVVLHIFTSRELGVADTMGLVPDRFTVLHDGLLVEFRAKP